MEMEWNWGSMTPKYDSKVHAPSPLQKRVSKRIPHRLSIGWCKSNCSFASIFNLLNYNFLCINLIAVQSIQKMTVLEKPYCPSHTSPLLSYYYHLQPSDTRCMGFFPHQAILCDTSWVSYNLILALSTSPGHISWVKGSVPQDCSTPLLIDLNSCSKHSKDGPQLLLSILLPNKKISTTIRQVPSLPYNPCLPFLCMTLFRLVPSPRMFSSTYLNLITSLLSVNSKKAGPYLLCSQLYPKSLAHGSYSQITATWVN